MSGGEQKLEVPDEERRLDVEFLFASFVRSFPHSGRQAGRHGTERCDWRDEQASLPNRQ